MVLEVMVENDQSQVPKVSELGEWADTYGLTMPVLSDKDAIMWQYADGMSSVGFPFTVVLDHGAVVDTIMSGANEGRAVKLLK